MRRARPSGYMTVARAIAEADARPWLGDLGQPTLLLCGEDDQVTGMDVSQTLLDQLPNASLLVIAGAGHAPHIEQADRFAHAVREFLQFRVEKPEPARARNPCEADPARPQSMSRDLVTSKRSTHPVRPS